MKKIRRKIMTNFEKEGFISFKEANPIIGSVVLLYFEDIDSYFVDTNTYNINGETEYSYSNEDGGGSILPSHWKYLKKDIIKITQKVIMWIWFYKEKI
jgi:hypothetical protein